MVVFIHFGDRDTKNVEKRCIIGFKVIADLDFEPKVRLNKVYSILIPVYTIIICKRKKLLSLSSSIVHGHYGYFDYSCQTNCQLITTKFRFFINLELKF